MPVLTITWHTHLDERTCPVCAPLDRYQWQFNTRRDVFPTVLRHPSVGSVWDVRVDEPRTHGVGSRRGPWNCRCWLTWRMDLSDVKQELLELLGSSEQWKGIGTVRVVRARGRFVTWRRV